MSFIKEKKTPIQCNFNFHLQNDLICTSIFCDPLQLYNLTLEFHNEKFQTSV